VKERPYVSYGREGNCNYAGTIKPYDILKVNKALVKAVPWFRRLVAGLSPQRPGISPGSLHVGFVVDKLALGQVFPRELWFSSVNFIPPVLHYKEKQKKLTIFITGLHNKP
jgi:hypothetical protein